MSIFSGLLEVMGVALIFPLISLINSPEIFNENAYYQKVLTTFSITSSQGAIYFFAGLIGGLFLLKNIYMTLFQRFQLTVVKDWNNSICFELMQRYLFMPYFHHLKRSGAFMINILSNTVPYVLNHYVFSQMNLFANFIVALILMLFILANYFWPSIITGLVFFSLTYLQSKFIRKRTSLVNSDINDIRTQNLKILSCSINGIKETKAFQAEEYFLKEYLRTTNQISNLNKKTQFFQVLPMYVNEAVLIVVVLVMALLVLSRESSPIVNVSNLAILAAVAFRIAPLINRILFSYSQIKLSEKATKDLLEEFKNVKLIKLESTKNKIEHSFSFHSKLELKNVSFSYDLKSNVLNNVNLKISKGELIGIAGTSGSGKSTLVDVIQGLLVPGEGELYLDDILIDIEKVKKLRELIGYVPQSPYIMNSTVKENVAFGISKNQIDEAKVDEVLKQSLLFDYFYEKLKGQNSVIADGGKSLSGGQKQRLAIARALYTDPDIIVLDEATSSLDVKTESEITKLVNKFKKIKTVIVIAHRLSTLKECDRIVFLEDGNILDVGSFQDLSRRNPKFLDMIKLSSLEGDIH